MVYNPVFALTLFLLLAFLTYVFFRPGKGWYWILKESWSRNEKTITEDILKELYRLETFGAKMDVSALTNSLQFKDEEIIESVHKMAIDELISLEDDLIKLTGEGRKYALRIIRVHRLWEKYLAEKTGFDKSEWHDRAEEMEHQLSHEETDILAIQLGNPIYDPHGDPIPNTKGKLKPLDGVSMSDLEVDFVGRIVHIEDEPDVIYRQILAQNIHIGSIIRILEKSHERIVFFAEGEEFKLAPVVASNITVNQLEPDLMEEDTVRLSSLKNDEKGSIVGISKECRGENRRRLLDLGFVRGTPISIDLNSPLDNPKAYSIKGTSIALRRDQASKILIKKDG